MKKCLSLFISAALLVTAALPASAQKAPSADQVLQRVAKKLAAVKALGYTYTREFNYPSEDYLSKSTSTGYLDLTSLAGPLGFRYQFEDEEYIAVYNGSESFIAIKKKKAMVVENNPPKRRMESSSSIYNSPLTLKYALPKIIADKKILKRLTIENVGGQRQVSRRVLSSQSVYHRARRYRGDEKRSNLDLSSGDRRNDVSSARGSRDERQE